MTRSVISVRGDDRISFLQGILTQDVSKLATQKIQFAAMLSPQGKILHDMFLIDDGDRILIDTATSFKDTLLKRLSMYKLRAKVMIEALSDMQVTLSSDQGFADPRHTALPMRLYSSNPPPTLTDTSLFHGIPVLGRDFMPDEIVAMDAGYDLLGAISFTKGCYVGQEVTARMHYKNIARKGFYLLTSDVATPCLALLKFEDVEKSGGIVTRDGTTYHARLPEWMAPKLAQHKANQESMP